MAHTCSECTYLKAGGDWPDYNGKYWCESKGEKIYANMQECWNYCNAYNRSDSVARSYRKYSEMHQSNDGCFITTITCEILGMDDKNVFLNSLRAFRKNVLQKNKETLKILEEYDFIGPLIAKKLRNDKDRLKIAENLFVNTIVPVCYNTDNGNYNNAIKLYLEMTKSLITNYNLDNLAITIHEDKKFDYTKDYSLYGHGRNYV